MCNSRQMNACNIRALDGIPLDKLASVDHILKYLNVRLKCLSTGHNYYTVSNAQALPIRQ